MKRCRQELVKNLGNWFDIAHADAIQLNEIILK